MDLKVKIIAGFREDQQYTISANEAHKAYYLFRNPEERGVFDNGVAIVGKNIQSIEPDYHATMGWNRTHRIDSDDLNEIRSLKIDEKLRDTLFSAKNLAYLIGDNNKHLLEQKMPNLLK